MILSLASPYLRLRHEMGMTSVVVTHDLSSAEALADRAVMMDHGRVIASGTMTELRACEDDRVRGFLTGRYRREEDEDAQ